MLNKDDYQMGSIVKLRKPHPSGTTEWEVVRLGADIKIHSNIEKTLFIMMSRIDFHKKVLKVVKY